MTEQNAPLFGTGEVVVSASALELLTAAGVPPRALIERHVCGDFGLVAGREARENLQAAATGVRVLSRYAVGEPVGEEPGGGQEEVWVMTHKNRSKTMIFDPREYGVERRRGYSAGDKRHDRP